MLLDFSTPLANKRFNSARTTLRFAVSSTLTLGKASSALARGTRCAFLARPSCCRSLELPRLQTVRYWDLRQPSPVAQVQLLDRCYSQSTSFSFPSSDLDFSPAAMSCVFPLLVVGTAERHIQIYDLSKSPPLLFLLESTRPFPPRRQSRRPFQVHPLSSPLPNPLHRLYARRRRLRHHRCRRPRRSPVCRRSEGVVQFQLQDGQGGPQAVAWCTFQEWVAEDLGGQHGVFPSLRNACDGGIGRVDEVRFQYLALFFSAAHRRFHTVSGTSTRVPALRPSTTSADVRFFSSSLSFPPPVPSPPSLLLPSIHSQQSPPPPFPLPANTSPVRPLSLSFYL
jgi:hypothetical protein